MYDHERRPAYITQEYHEYVFTSFSADANDNNDGNDDDGFEQRMVTMLREYLRPEQAPEGLRLRLHTMMRHWCHCHDDAA